MALKGLSQEATDRYVNGMKRDLPHKYAEYTGRPLPEPLDERVVEIAERFTPVDWHELLTGERPPPDWLWEPVVEAGRQVALFAEAKAGKSLIMLEACCGIASGRSTLGNPSRKPRDIVYIDQENTQDDLADRVLKLGYEHGELERLHYYSFPSMSFLDTVAGGEEVLAMAKYNNASLVVIDTLSRVIEGDENDSAPYHSFYRNTGRLLKRDGVALVRLDHSGKDATRGMRGSSAKTTDVDSVWMMSSDGERVTLQRTHSRNARGADHVEFLREDDPLRHVTSAAVDLVTQAEARLDLIEYPEDGAVRNAHGALKEAGYPCDRNNAEAAQRRRKQRHEEREVAELLPVENPSRKTELPRPATPQDGTDGMVKIDPVLRPSQDGAGRSEQKAPFSPETQGSDPSCDATGRPRPEGAADTEGVPSCDTASLRSRTQGQEDAQSKGFVPVDTSYLDDMLGGEQ